MEFYWSTDIGLPAPASPELEDPGVAGLASNWLIISKRLLISSMLRKFFVNWFR